MKVNFKSLTFFIGGAALIVAPIVLVKSSHYTPRFENNEKKLAQSWAGAAEYYHMLKADPITGLINEGARSLAEKEAMLREQNSALYRTNSALSLNWTELGPDNVGGRVRAIVFDKNTQNVIYAGGVSGGIFKSIDGGSSWNPVNDQLSNMIISCMDQDASGNNIYFGTGETLGSFPSGDGNSSFNGNGLYKLNLSTNAVTSVTSTVTFKNITNIKCNKTNNYIYLGTSSNGFRISKDAGATWINAKLSSTGAVVGNSGEIIDIKCGTDNSYVFTSAAGVYRSVSGDENVSAITPSTSILADKTSVEIGIAPLDPQIIYLASARGDSKLGGVCYTMNGGASWYKIANSSSTTFDPFISGGNGQGQYDNSITVSPINSGLVYFGGASYWKWNQTSPGLGTWNYAAYQFAVGTQQYVHSDIHAFEWDPFNSNKLLVGCDGGLFRSIDGGNTYSAINKGFNVTQPYAIAFERYPSLGLTGFPMGGVASGNQDNGTTYVPGTFNGTKSAYPLGGGDGNFLDFSNIAPDAVFSSIYYGQVDRAANKGPMGGSEFVDGEYSKVNGGPGSGSAFASFVTPIKLWESSSDMTSIDSVWFKAPVVSNNSAGLGDGATKIFKSKIIRTDNSAIFDSLYLTLGTATTGINYTSPLSSTKVGTVITTYTTSTPFTIGSNSGSVIATRYGIAFGMNPEIDSIKVVFTSAPANASVLKTTMTEMFNSGADVKVTTETTSGTKFGYTLPTALAARGKIRVPDILQARLAIGLTNRVVVVKKPLNFGISPDWCTAASSLSRDESGANAAFTGVVQTMEWDPSGDNLYVGTQSGALYRISHLKQLNDSVFVKSIDSLKANMIDSITFQRKNSPIRCTRIGSLGSVITSISVDPINGSKIIVTCGTYGSNVKVYYGVNPATHPATTGVGLFVTKMGTGTSGLISTAPVYSSLIEVGDTKRVLVGTEYGLYATSDITATNPVWTKENNSKLPNVPVFMIRQQTNHSAFCYNSGMIYVGTHGRGIWACDTYYNKTFVGINEIAAKDKTAVNSIKLYPNPARDFVNLSFNITKTENLMLSIYDLKGVLVYNKNIGKLPEGEQIMQVSTEDLISGTYIVSLNSSDAVIGTNRLIVIK